MGTLGGIPLDVGDVLAKKYRLDRLVGEGGTGIVVAAHHLQLDRPVAIKFLRTALASEEILLRFEREARAIGQIASEHVVVVFDVGTLEDQSPYMVMEYLEGRDLARILKEDGPLPYEEAVDCMLQVCEALGEAHAAGIVHRDLKPANLFLTHRDDGGPHVKVVDFGISKILDAKLLGAGPHEMTNAFTVLGSPRYMAPEQLRNSKDVDERADLWSVGAVLFQLVTGKHAFEGDSNVHASLAVLTKEPALLRHYATAPAELEAIINKCLTKDVTERFQTAEQLALALRPLASERTRESLDRMQAAREEPSVNVALNVASVSEASQAPPSKRAPEPAPGLTPPLVPRSEGGGPGSSERWASPPPRRLRPVGLLVGLGIAAFVLMIGLLVFAKTAAEWMGFLASGSAPPAAEPRATVQGPSTAVTVTLDAGRAPP
ncbi:MAG: serine/threonine protein kinase [Labilithrix sp.]|nr:serine/threonine protein kinase [Labilithrix sp.]